VTRHRLRLSPEASQPPASRVTDASQVRQRARRSAVRVVAHRRAAVSIPSNIGEGKRRKRQRAFLYHLDIALNAQGELEVQLEIVRRLGFESHKDIEPVVDRVAEVGRMLNGLIESLQVERPGY